MPKITVIIPVYQVEAYLSRCIESLINQTYHDFEMVLVDDGSPDRCGMICDAYAARDSRIHVIHQENNGLSAARNAGINWSFSNSKSEWISFVNSDDWVQPEYLEWMITAAEKNESGIVIGGHAITKGEPLPPLGAPLVSIWKVPEYYLHDVTNATVSWGKLYKKDCFSSIRFPIGKLHEDEFVSYKILFRFKYITVIEQPLYAHCQNQEELTKQIWSPTRLDRLEALEDQIDFFSEKGYLEIARRRLNGLIWNNMDCQERIEKSCFLTIDEKRKYINVCKVQLRRILIKYRKRKWYPYQKSEWNKHVYATAFPSVQIGRDIWKKVKKTTSLNPIFEFLRHGLGDYLEIKAANDRLLCYIKETRLKKVILLQTPVHGNLGDQAIAEAETELLSELNILFCEFPWTSNLESKCAKHTSDEKIIFLHGGGYLGQLWPNEEKRVRDTLKAFRNNKVIIFPQTVYFDMDTEEGRKCFEESKAVYESHPNLTIFLRELFSYDFMRHHMPKVNIKLVPDIVMMFHWEPLDLIRRDALLCMRHDKEKTITEEDYNKILMVLNRYYEKQIVTDTNISSEIDITQRHEILEQKLKEFSAAALVVTDRLHGMIFAAITETPCIVINSLSHKIRGCYNWLKDLDYIRLVDDLEQLPDEITRLKAVQPKYDRSKIRCAMEPLFEVLRECL